MTSFKDIKAISYFKIKELDNKYKIIKNGMTILELGCYPGGISQYILEYPQVKILAVDKRLTTHPNNTNNYKFKQLNIFNNNLISYLKTQTAFDLIISDVCENISGIKSRDRASCIKIINRIKLIEKLCLKAHKNLIFKILEENLDKRIKTQFTNFKKILFKRTTLKKHTSEKYVLCIHKSKNT
ncbi:SAM-dependent methyltransferase [Candidatus Vidania fulgoroideae]|uniref:Ribosomal RNA large subunit methyltransferase E n=1 Tax=Candidatus Vidania fulgoroideorum TaxID=881286 RepID=A0A974X7J3_9PROT|nr:SAM-dependent methyltransferase [Candidatus Vidania fulgoroideae]